MSRIRQFADQVADNVEQVIVGKRAAIETLLIALLNQGHVLVEDVPGVGKTMLARAMAASLGLVFKRIQCTPDLLPNDITGTSVFDQKTREFEFRPGPAFANVVLADEINRATPRTQSALLEAMGEHQVSVDGVTYPLPRPFIVMATQNPVEFEGTFPLPEAQLDRFMLRLPIGYPTPEQEAELLKRLSRVHPIETLQPVVDGKILIELERDVWQVEVDSTVARYIVQLVGATRDHPDLALGASPRAALALYKATQAFAALRGRDYVLPDDVKTMAPLTLNHRLLVKPESALRGRMAPQIMSELVATILVPLTD